LGRGSCRWSFFGFDLEQHGFEDGFEDGFENDDVEEVECEECEAPIF